ncbi:MAG: glutathione S-transferase family protein [Acidobacteriota bacterium]
MTSPLKVHVYPGADGLPSLSPVCVKAVLALERAGLPHEVVLSRGRGTSPSGRLPMLEIDGRQVTDSTVILDVIEEQEGAGPLGPPDPRERARDLAWEHFVDGHFYWVGVYLRWVVPDNKRRTLDLIFPKAWMRHLIGPLVARNFAGRTRGQGVGLKSESEVRRDLTRVLDIVEASIGDGPFLDGRDEPGRGDLALASTLPQITFRGLTPQAGAELVARPSLVAYVERVFAACGRPAPKMEA